MKTSELQAAFEYLQKRKVLSPTRLKIVKIAIASNNPKTLSFLGKIFTDYIRNEKKVVTNFISAKDRLLGEFQEVADMVKADYVDVPKKKKITKTEKQDQLEADSILKQLDDL